MLLGCDPAESSAEASLAIVTDQGVEIKASQLQLAALFQDVKGPVPEMLTVPATIEEAEAMSNPIPFQFETYEVSGKGDAFYAIARGTTEEGNCYTVAKRLLRDGNRIGPMAQTTSGSLARAETGESHTCTGVACAECNFERNSNDEITGCQECADVILPRGHCNHTVTSGG